MTLEQWAELPEEESGELIDGFLLEEEVPDPVHELAVAWLVVLFGNWLRGKGGFVFGSEVKLRISQERGRKADVVVYLPGRPPPPRRGLLTEPPDVVVEGVGVAEVVERTRTRIVQRALASMGMEEPRPVFRAATRTWIDGGPDRGGGGAAGASSTLMPPARARPAPRSGPSAGAPGRRRR